MNTPNKPTPAQQRQAAITAPPSGKLNLNKPASDQGDLRRFLQTPLVQEQVAGIIPKHLTPERVTGLMLSATMRTPKLLKCTMMSILQGMIQVSELGLELSPAFGHLYLIPYENRKQGVVELQIQVAYGGLAHLVYNATGFLLDTVPVFHGDPFVYQEGSDPHITHEVNLDADRTEQGMRAVYCRVQTDKGQKVFELMTRKQVDAIRQRSKSPDQGPWVTDYVEMARKSVLRRITKRLPKSAENQHLARALEVEDSQVAETVNLGDAVSSAMRLPPGRSIVSAVPSNFSLTAPDDEKEAPPAQAAGVADGEAYDDQGVLPDAPQEPLPTDPIDNLVARLQRAQNADAVKALKAEVDGLRSHERFLDLGKAYAEAAKRVQS